MLCGLFDSCVCVFLSMLECLLLFNSVVLSVNNDLLHCCVCDLLFINLGNWLDVLCRFDLVILVTSLLLICCLVGCFDCSYLFELLFCCFVLNDYLWILFWV